MAVQNPQAYSLLDVHKHLARQGRFSEARERFGWLVEIWIVRSPMYPVEGRVEDACRGGISESFLDESDLIRPWLESAKGKTDLADRARFSDRKLEVLKLLAVELSYKGTGRKFFLSLNPVQFHVKRIYRNLSVNKRVQAVEKARELHWI